MPRVLFTTINSGQKVSADIDLTKYAPAVVAFPILTGAESGDYFLQGCFDQVSGSFLRMAEMRAPGSGDFRLAAGIGSRMFALPTVHAWPAWMRLEAAVAVADVRTFTILARSQGMF